MEIESAFYVEIRKGSDNLRFEYYVLNHNLNRDKIELFNIFDNYYVQEWTEKEIKKYIRSPKNYKYESFFKDEKTTYDVIASYVKGYLRLATKQENRKMENPEIEESKEKKKSSSLCYCWDNANKDDINEFLSLIHRINLNGKNIQLTIS